MASGQLWLLTHPSASLSVPSILSAHLVFILLMSPLCPCPSVSPLLVELCVSLHHHCHLLSVSVPVPPSAPTPSILRWGVPSTQPLPSWWRTSSPTRSMHSGWRLARHRAWAPSPRLCASARCRPVRVSWRLVLGEGGVQWPLTWPEPLGGGGGCLPPGLPQPWPCLPAVPQFPQSRVGLPMEMRPAQNGHSAIGSFLLSLGVGPVLSPQGPKAVIPESPG